MQDSSVPPTSKVDGFTSNNALAYALGAILAPAIAIALRDPDVRAAVAAFGLGSSERAKDLDESAAAKVVGATKTTFKRAKIEADYFVGTRPRWRDAESVRAKFAARGKARTTPPRTRTTAPDDVDVSSALSAGGLRAVAGGRR